MQAAAELIRRLEEDLEASERCCLHPDAPQEQDNILLRALDAAPSQRAYLEGFTAALSDFLALAAQAGTADPEHYDRLAREVRGR
jgi:hypothetical protein